MFRINLIHIKFYREKPVNLKFSILNYLKDDIKYKNLRTKNKHYAKYFAHFRINLQ